MQALVEQSANWSATAGLHSQLTGVMAGFAFAAIALFLSNPPRHNAVGGIGAPVCSLLVTFLALILSSFLFASMASEAVDKEAVTALFVWPSVVFAVAAAQLLLSLVWFLQAYHLDASVVRTGGLVLGGAIFVAALGISDTIYAFLAYERGYQPVIPVLFTVLLPLLVIPFAGLLVRWRFAKRLKWLGTTLSLQIAFYVCFVISLASATVYEANMFQAPVRTCVVPLSSSPIRWIVVGITGLHFLVCVLALPRLNREPD